MGARAVLNGNLVLVRSLPGWQDGKVNDAQGGSGVKRPTTLAIDIGGTGLKASVLDADGAKIVSRVRTKTPYPCWPRVLVRELDKLTHQLPSWDRVCGWVSWVRSGWPGAHSAQPLDKSRSGNRTVSQVGGGVGRLPARG